MLLKFLFVLFERQSYKFLPDLFIQMYKAKRKKDFVNMTHSPSLQILGSLFTKENGNLGTSELRTMITVYWSFLCLHSEKPLHGIHRGLWFCLGSFPKVSPYTGLQQAIPRNQRKRSLHKKGVRACYVSKSCLTLCDPMDCGLPGSSVCGILQARVLEWVAMPSSWGSSRHRDRTLIS